MIFILVIFNDLKNEGKISQEVKVDNIFKIIDKRYGSQSIVTKVNGREVDILPLMTSIISSCPIDADRMDYLLRDSYFSGVKCGIYDYNRLFMSVVPVEEDNKIYLAYKESGIDSIAEFIGARSGLFSQVYFHKTNRAFSSMLNKLCENMLEKHSENLIISDLTGADIPEPDEKSIEFLEEFYISCSDDYFLNEKVAEWVYVTQTESINKKILDDIINRHPWSKIYEAKYFLKNASITDKGDTKLKVNLHTKLTPILERYLKHHQYAIDVVSDNAFKDIDKTEVKLLVKNIDNTYKTKSLEQCGDKLDQYQSIKYFVRVFVDRDIKESLPSDLINKINEAVMTEIAHSD